MTDGVVLREVDAENKHFPWYGFFESNGPTADVSPKDETLFYVSKPEN